MHGSWQDVDERCHLCHSWRDVAYRIITAMNSAALPFLFLGGSWLLAILGGLGVGGLGKDSRDLGVREHSAERKWRSLLSR
jgi:hypothetical protein